MRPPCNIHTHNINKLFMDEANSCRFKQLSQESLTQILGNLLIPEEKPSFVQSLQDKVSRINELVLRNLYYKSHPKLGFYGCVYCKVVS